jgi:itaconyl-CoA hydratase
VLEIRESKSRPNQGIVNIRSRGLKADGTEVINFERAMLIPTRGHAVDDVLDY